MNKSILLLIVAASSAVQAGTSFSPVRRQFTGPNCGSGEKACGTVCIELTDICCPALNGGCLPTERCDTFGCCPKDQECGGGVITRSRSGNTITSTIEVTQGTSTVIESPAETLTSTCANSGYKDCGTGCIELNYTCCLGLNAGCPPTHYCNSVGCCPLGKTCSGGGGVVTQPGSGETITSTIEEPQETSTVIEPTLETASLLSTDVEVPLVPVAPTSSVKPTTPRVTGSPSTSPSATLLAAAADKISAFSPFNMLAFLMPFLFA